MYCPNCGRETRPGGAFCAGCGAPVNIPVGSPADAGDLQQSPQSNAAPDMRQSTETPPYSASGAEESIVQTVVPGTEGLAKETASAGAQTPAADTSYAGTGEKTQEHSSPGEQPTPMFIPPHSPYHLFPPQSAPLSFRSPHEPTAPFFNPQPNYNPFPPAPSSPLTPPPLHYTASPHNPSWAPPPLDVKSLPDVRLRPLSLGELFDEALRLYRVNFGRFTAALAAFIVPMLVLRSLGIYFDSALNATPARFLDDLGKAIQNEPELLIITSAAYIPLFLITVLFFWFYPAMTFKMASDARLGAPVDARAAFAFSRSRAGSLLWTSLLYILATSLGTAALFLPGLVVLITYIFSLHAVLLEDRGGTAAMRRSAYLVQSNWWRTFLIMLLCFIFVTTVSELPAAAMSLFSQLLPFLARELITASITQAAMLFLLPPPLILLTLHYYDLRMRKEGLDIELACEELWP